MAATRCPECGLRYDPSDVETYLLRPRTRWERLASPVKLSAVVGTYVLAWWVHVASTLLDDPLGMAFDTANWLVCIVLKMCALAALLVLLGRSCGAIAGDHRAAWRAFAIWSATSVAFVCAMAALRSPLSDALHTDTAKYYSVAGVHASDIGGEEWLPRWRRGEIVVLELSFAVLWAALFAYCGYRVGGNPFAAVSLAVFGGIMMMLVHVNVFDLVAIDYDNFHGDVFTGGLLFDILLPFIVMDPYGTVGTFVYAGAALSCLLILRNPNNDPRAARRTEG